MNCPGCSEPMAEQRFEGNYGTTLVLDICHACQGLWFDKQESLQLSPGSTLRLFRIIHEKQAERRNQPAEGTSCPRCGSRLVETQDMVRATRFGYSRCPKGDGRFITFFQFLREKSFVRTLDLKQVAELRRYVRTVGCSNCGAAVDLEKSAVCGYCRSPLAILDPKQIEATVRELQQWEEKRTTIDPTVQAQLLLDKLKVEALYAQRERELWSDGGPSGLVEAGLGQALTVLKGALPESLLRNVFKD